jgi:hypothetical protein
MFCPIANHDPMALLNRDLPLFETGSVSLKILSLSLGIRAEGH